MKLVLVRIVSNVAAISFVAGACAHPHPADLAVRDAAIVDVIDGSLTPNQTILIEGNRITLIGPADDVQVAANAEVVEAAGKYLIPGLWDMHVHSVANMAWDMRVSSIAAMDWHFPLFLAHGVTGVRNMDDGTADVTLELTNSVKRRRLPDGDLPGPRFLTSGPSLDGDPPLGSNSAVVRTAVEARAIVDGWPTAARTSSKSRRISPAKRWQYSATNALSTTAGTRPPVRRRSRLIAETAWRKLRISSRTTTS